MKYFFFCFFILLTSCNAVKDYKSSSMPVTHELWDELVKTHVTEAGVVDYEGIIKDSAKLQKYLDLLSSAYPNEQNWSRDQRLAYWINAYNAFTVKLIVDHYPVGSIKDIKDGIVFVNTVWDIKFIKIEKVKYDLNNIEHGIIRKRFKEPRIHFACNCAAISCPRLRNEAYTAERLDEQLTDQAKYFLRNEGKNKISKDKVELSSILKWYGGDFDAVGGVRAFVNEYGPLKFPESTEINFLPYYWPLNNTDVNDYTPPKED